MVYDRVGLFPHTPIDPPPGPRESQAPWQPLQLAERSAPWCIRVALRISLTSVACQREGFGLALGARSSGVGNVRCRASGAMSSPAITSARFSTSAGWPPLLSGRSSDTLIDVRSSTLRLAVAPFHASAGPSDSGLCGSRAKLNPIPPRDEGGRFRYASGDAYLPVFFASFSFSIRTDSSTT